MERVLEAAWRERNGLDYSLYKNKNKKQLILLSRQKKTTTNHQQTFFLSDCKSVYKCTACGCVRGCVIGKVYQHPTYRKEMFPIRALRKAHVGYRRPPRFFYGRTWYSPSPFSYSDTFLWKALVCEISLVPRSDCEGFFVCTKYPQQVRSKNTFIILLVF